MELELQLDELKCYSCVLDTVMRREETQEAIVPDALPDIGTIINTTATVMLHRCDAMDASAVCEGAVHAMVLFQPEDNGAPAAVDVKLPLHCVMEVPGLKGEHKVHISAALARLDARVINPRKVLVRAELLLHTQAYEAQKLQLTSGVAEENDHLQTRVKQTRLSYISHVAQRSFPFEETVALGASQRRISRLLSCDTAAYCTEAKVVGTKIVFKGGIKVKVRYLDEENDLVSERFDLPVSHVLDGGGSREQAVAKVSLGLENTQVGYYDENSISLSMELFAYGVVYEQTTVQLLEDAYSTKENCACQMAEQHLQRLLEHKTQIYPFRQSLDLELTDAEVIDEHIALTEVLSEDSGIAPRCRLIASICVKDSSGRLIRLEQGCFVELPEQTGQTKVDVSLLDCACMTAAGGAELRGTLLVSTTEMEEETARFLCALTLEAPPKSEERRPSAVLRKLMPGECLWEIGKRYGAKVSDIMTVNHIEKEDAAAGKFLLIPRHR